MKDKFKANKPNGKIPGHVSGQLCGELSNELRNQTRNETSAAERSSPSDSAWASEFRIYLEELAEVVGKVGVLTVPYRDPDLESFAKLAPNVQQKTCCELRAYIDSLKHSLYLFTSDFEIENPTPDQIQRREKIRAESGFFSETPPDETQH